MGAVGTRTGCALVTAWCSLISISYLVGGVRGLWVGQAASFESLARNSDRGEAGIGLEGESESWEGSLWECGHHHRARWGPWLDTHELLSECGHELTARAPGVEEQGTGTCSHSELPLPLCGCFSSSSPPPTLC